MVESTAKSAFDELPNLSVVSSHRKQRSNPQQWTADSGPQTARPHSPRSAPPQYAPPGYARGGCGGRGRRGKRDMCYAHKLLLAVIARSAATKQSPRRRGDCFPHASLGTCASLAMTMWARRLLSPRSAPPRFARGKRFARNDKWESRIFYLMLPRSLLVVSFCIGVMVATSFL